MKADLLERVNALRMKCANTDTLSSKDLFESQHIQTECDARAEELLNLTDHLRHKAKEYLVMRDMVAQMEKKNAP